MTVIVFLGPSLPLFEARQVLDAIYLPPAGQGDLLSAVAKYRPRTIGLIDGVFHHSLSVWHKEILDALERGVNVYGAASMGAIRAAETERFGTIGVGEIFKKFASGELEDDDEVAVVQGPPELGYQALSDAMVNIRATLDAAVSQSIVEPETARRIIAIAKGTYFPDRRLATVLDAALSQGTTLEEIGRLREFARTEYVDLKRQDALKLLVTLRDSASTTLQPRATPPPRKPAHPRSVYFDILNSTDRKVPAGDFDIDLSSVVKHAAISGPRFEDVAFTAHNRRLAVMLSELTGIAPGPDDVDAANRRFRTRHDLETDDAFEHWLVDNDLSKREFDDLMYTVACARLLHRWSSYVARAGWARDVLDELRLSDGYVDAKRAAAEAEQSARSEDPVYDRRTAEEDDLAELAVDQAVATGWRLDTDAREWAEEVGFKDRDDFQVALLRASLARRYAKASARENNRRGPNGPAR